MSQPLSSVPVTAVLDDAVRMQGLSGEFLVGNVSYDLLNRWPNGTRIHSSYIVDAIDEATFRDRAGSTYRVVSWRD